LRQENFSWQPSQYQRLNLENPLILREFKNLNFSLENQTLRTFKSLQEPQDFWHWFDSDRSQCESVLPIFRDIFRSALVHSRMVWTHWSLCTNWKATIESTRIFPIELNLEKDGRACSREKRFENMNSFSSKQWRDGFQKVIRKETVYCKNPASSLSLVEWCLLSEEDIFVCPCLFFWRSFIGGQKKVWFLSPVAFQQEHSIFFWESAPDWAFFCSFFKALNNKKWSSDTTWNSNAILLHHELWGRYC